MKEKFEDHICKIAEFPEYIRQNRLSTFGLAQREEKIKSLTKHLRDQLELLDFELFITIMGNKEYDTQIYYSAFQTKDWDLKKWERHASAIPELKKFFESAEHTNEQKKAIEEIIIFGLFLQATRDYCTSLDSLTYLELLDNLSYKCNPAAYKVLSSLNEIALWLVLSSWITVPLTVLLILAWPEFTLLLGIMLIALALGLVAASLIYPAVSSICNICNSTADKNWGTNWAYPLPGEATEYTPVLWNMNPYEIGIFPSLFGYPKIPAGSSFKAMNRLGFFPFEEIANEAIDIVTDGGKVSVNLPNRFKSLFSS